MSKSRKLAHYSTLVEPTTLDGRDVSVDGTKLDGIEPLADVTDTTNVVAALTAGNGVDISAGGIVAVSAVALTTVQTAVSEIAHLALSTQEGDVVVRSDLEQTFMHNGGSAGTIADFTLLSTPTDSVTSVDGLTGVVTLNHDSLAGFVANEHVDYTAGGTFGGDIDVTGTATMDGLVVGSGTYHQLVSTFPDTYTTNLQIGQQGNISNNALTDTLLINHNSQATQANVLLSINNKSVLKLQEGGDISFYEDTGTTAKFFWDASAESLGIGVIPAEVLDLKASSGDTRIRLDALSGSDTEIKFFNDGVAEYTIGHDDATDNFVIGSVNVDAPMLSVNKSGNVGIGTSSPENLLHLHNTAGDSFIRLSGGGSLGEKYGGFVRGFGVTGEGGNLDLGVIDNNVFKTAINVQPQGNEIRFSTSSTERMRIDSSGNVGIGTDTPDGALDIEKTVNTAWSSALRANEFLQISNPSTTSGAYSGIELIATGTGSAGAAEIVCIESGSGSGDLAFSTRNSGTWSEKVRVTAAGNVGIGTSAPIEKVSIQSGNLRFQSSSDVAINTVVGEIIGSPRPTAPEGSGMASIKFISDATTWHKGVISFCTNDLDGTDAANPPLERMRIDAAGNLLVGTLTSANPESGFTVTSGGGTKLQINHANGTASGVAYATFRYNQSTLGSITQNGTSATLYSTSSDYRLKDITGPLQGSGDYIDSLNPVEGTWKLDGSVFVGLIAHEADEVSRTKIATGEKDGEEMQSMDYSSAEMIANLIKEVQSLRKRVLQLEGS